MNIAVEAAHGLLRRWTRMAGLVVLVSVLQTQAKADDAEVVFGLVPALSPEAMVRRYQPLATYLVRETGVRIRLEGAPNYEIFMNRVLEGAHYDMIVTGGDFYRLAERRAGYRAIVRVDGPGVQAIIVAARDDNFTSLDDLPEGLRIASVGALALMHRLGSRKLREHGIIIDQNATLVPTPSHNAAMHSVLSDQADIAIIAAPFFGRVKAGIRDRIVILERSALAPHHPISVSADVPEDVVVRLTGALLAMPDTPDGLAALAAMNFPGFVVPEPGLYEVMDWAADDIESHLGLESE